MNAAVAAKPTTSTPPRSLGVRGSFKTIDLLVIW
jgi:hypothetical protein